MCGIALLVSTGDGDGCAPHQPPSFRSLYPAIQRSNRLRGPDQSATVTLEVDRHDANTLALSLSSSVLGLRGSPLTSQPLQSQDARVLFAWNGQIFDWKQQVHAQPSSSKAKLDDGHNDGQLLFDAIQARLQHLERDDRALDSGAAAIEAVRATLADVEGPYAFVLLDKASGLLVYGRDPLGRRSLLLGHDPAQGMILASVSCLEAVAAGLEMQEVDCSALWSIALREPSMTPSRIERRSKLSEPLRLHELEDPSALEEQRFTPRSLHERLSSAAAFEAVLAESVRSRVTQIRSTGAADEAHLAILFSGGLDCATLARLADRFVPREQPIDLLNVGFENPRAIKSARLEAEKALKRAEKLRAQERRRKAKETGLPLHPSRAPGGADVDTEANAEAEAEAEAARVRGDPVAEADIYDVPDRLTGRATHAELVRLAPQRRWNFVEINVTYAEYCEARPTIEALMHPTASVMDLVRPQTVANRRHALGCIELIRWRFSSFALRRHRIDAPHRASLRRSTLRRAAVDRYATRPPSSRKRIRRRRAS
ncbi:hypothetical protein ACQY0O_007447 [Thecaphora frezii]